MNNEINLSLIYEYDTLLDITFKKMEDFVDFVFLISNLFIWTTDVI